jgi:SWI/SNF-related matrix-associated actin-dependent regulator 1 of chromatin subfamily A
MKLPFELEASQAEGIDSLAANRRFYLWDRPGFGKTVQLLGAAEKVGAERVLIGCPAGIALQWQQKMREYDFKIKADVASYNKLADRAAHFRKEKYDVFILDEGHAVKNAKAKRTKAILGAKCDAVGGIVENIPYVWDSTGSPAPNNYAELWTKMRALTPGAITMQSGKVLGYWDFVNKFCVVQDTAFGAKIVGNKDSELLKTRIAPFMLRRKRDSQPPRIDTLTLQPADALKALRDVEQSEEGQEIARVLEQGGVEGLAALAGGQTATIRRLTGLAIVAPLVAQITDEVDGGLDKLVVIAYHRDVIEGIRDGLRTNGISSVVYMGGMTAKQQDDAKHAFINDEKCQVFIGQITAAGTGTDGLQTVCKDMLLAEYSWVPEENGQIIARLDRRGGLAGVLVRFAALAGSIHEKISAAQARKVADIIALLG